MSKLATFKSSDYPSLLSALFLKPHTPEEDEKMCRNVSCDVVVVRWEMLELPQHQCVKCPCIISLHLTSLYNGVSQSNYEETLCWREKSVMLEFNLMKQCMLIFVCDGCWVLFRKKEELSPLNIEPYCAADWCAVCPFRIVCQQSTCLWPLRFTLHHSSKILPSSPRQYWVLLAAAISQSHPRPEDKSC